MSPPDRPALPLVFIGPMAAGKSKLGRRVARRLDVPFVDTDQRIVAEYGPIDEIFEREGEEYFRVIEREVVAEALNEAGVVSLGGGAVLHADTRAQLSAASVVYLWARPEAVALRLGSSRRPLVDAGGIEAWTRIFQERRPVYEELASVSFDTSRRPMRRIVDGIVAWFDPDDANGVRRDGTIENSEG